MSGAPWVRPDGVLVAKTPADFMSGTLLAPISLHADGSNIITDAWIGSSVGPNAIGSAAETCNNWSSASSSVNGWIGDPFTAGYLPWNALSEACSGSFALYCLEN
jgi:hypothetical protein